MDRPYSGNISAPLNGPDRYKELISRIEDYLPVLKAGTGIRRIWEGAREMGYPEPECNVDGSS